jgi:hypothetical protein
LNGETCYVLLTDHYSGRIFGRHSPPKLRRSSGSTAGSPAMLQIVQTSMFAWMGVANSANVVTFTVPLRTLATQLSLLVPTRHTKMDLANAHTRQSAMHFVPCFLARIYNQTSGHMHSTITSDSTTLFPMVTDRRAHTKCVALRSPTWQSFGHLDVVCTCAQQPLATVASFPTLDLAPSLATRAP